MGSVLKLPCVRFVRQVSAGVSTSKYGYVGMMQNNLEALKEAPWRKAACAVADASLTVNKVSETDGEWGEGVWTKKPTYTAFIKDQFDCYKQGGDARPELGTFCAYAGMVAYRFTLPMENPGAVDEIKLLIQRDRYLRSGVRIAVEINSEPEPSSDWATIRGELDGSIATPSTPTSGVLGVSQWGFLNQSEVLWLLASRPGEETLVISREEFSALERAASEMYLWVYLSIEDYADYWELYDAKAQRYYSIEGSAALVTACCSFAFSTDAVAPESAEEPQTAAELAECTGYARPIDVPAAIRGSFDGLRACAGCFIPNRSTGQDLMARLRADGDACITGLSTFDLGAMSNNMKVPLSGANKFGAVMLGWGDYVGWSNMWDRLFVYAAISEANKGGGISVDENGMYFAHAGARLIMGSKVLHVPPEREKYSKVRVRFSKMIRSPGGREIPFDIISFGLPGIRFNVWRSKSVDFHTHLWRVAAAALASQGAFYTAAKRQISGSFTGTGGIVDGVTVSAQAEFVKDFAFDKSKLEYVGDKWLFELDVDCESGDTLIISPQLHTIRPGIMCSTATNTTGVDKGACWYAGYRYSSDHPETEIREDCALDADLVSVVTGDWSFL